MLRLRPKKFLWLQLRNIYNPLRRWTAARPPLDAQSPALRDIRRRQAERPSDISDHLESLFIEALTARPKLMVELGVRGGESTFVLERVAALLGSKLISVDIEPCLSASQLPGWIFVQKDDVQFAREFPDFCQARGIVPPIDFLFIDTSHHYAHTVEEIRHWFPLLAPQARVIFHDTHMGEIYFRKDGTIGFGWDNERGVIRAIEEYLGRPLNEKKDFVELHNGWLIRHTAASNGFTVLDRLPPTPAVRS